MATATSSSTIELQRPGRLHLHTPPDSRSHNSSPPSNQHDNHNDSVSVFEALNDDPPLTSHTAPANATPRLRPVTKRRQITVLLSAFFAVFLTIGLNQAYGVFLAYYVSTGSDPNGPDPFLPPSTADNKALLAFVGTLGAGLTWAGSIVVNPLMARLKDPRYITVAGAGLIAGGYLMASGCKQVYQLLLTQGLTYGIGSSLLYFPMLAVAPEYFDSHRAAAMGFILSGAGIGGLAFAPLTRLLLARIGAAWTLRAIGLIAFIIGTATALAAPESRSLTRRPTLVNWTVARKPTFYLSALGAMSQAGGNFVPLTFLPEFTTRLGYSAAFGASLLAVLNAVNTVTRIGTGFLADKVGRQNTLMMSVLASAVVVVAFWLNAAWDEQGGLWIAFVITYGAFSGGEW
jgi:MFS family permease